MLKLRCADVTAPTHHNPGQHLTTYLSHIPLRLSTLGWILLLYQNPLPLRLSIQQRVSLLPLPGPTRVPGLGCLSDVHSPRKS